MAWRDWRLYMLPPLLAYDEQDCVPHYKLCERAQLANLRPADPFMMQTTVSAREWPPPENFDEEQWERNVNK